jgi:hypothetical protein
MFIIWFIELFISGISTWFFFHDFSVFTEFLFHNLISSLIWSNYLSVFSWNSFNCGLIFSLNSSKVSGDLCSLCVRQVPTCYTSFKGQPIYTCRSVHQLCLIVGGNKQSTKSCSGGRELRVSAFRSQFFKIYPVVHHPVSRGLWDIAWSPGLVLRALSTAWHQVPITSR